MKNNKYTVKDSCFAFILSIVMPSVLAVIVLMIASGFTNLETFQTTKIYKILSLLISQVAFLMIFITISAKRKASIKNNLFKKLNLKSVFIVVLISLICLFLLSPLVNVYDAFLTSIGISEQSLSLDLNSVENLIFLILIVGVFAPICEELVFRGVILGGLKKYGDKKAILISALLFMLMHLSLHQTIYQFVLGIILGCIFIYTGNIFATILVHFINNTSVLLINYFSPSFFEYRFLTTNYIILALVLFAVGLFFIFNLLKVLKKNYKNDDSFVLINETTNALQDSEEQFYLKNLATIKEKKYNNYLKTTLVFGVLLWLVTVILSI